MAKAKSRKKLKKLNENVKEIKGKPNWNSFEKFLGKYVGSGAFILGMIFALIIGLSGVITSIWIILLIVIGLLIGILNITKEETTAFLVSGVVLIIISVLGGSAFYNLPFAGHVLDALIMIFIPAVVIVAMKNIFNLAKD